jgi:hypothetical protein
MWIVGWNDERNFEKFDFHKHGKEFKYCILIPVSHLSVFSVSIDAIRFRWCVCLLDGNVMIKNGEVFIGVSNNADKSRHKISVCICSP